MRLELEDFTPFSEFQTQKEEKKEESDGVQTVEELQRFYEQKIKELENQYKELLAQVSKESYEKAYEEAKKEYEQTIKEQIENIVKEKEKEKKEALAHYQTSIDTLQKSLFDKHRSFVEKFTDIIVDSIIEILEFLYIDKSNRENVVDAIGKLLADFSNYLPLTINVPSSLYEEAKRNFHSIEVKENSELEENEFIIEFHSFKIENKIKEKLSVIKDEIKRETKKLT